MTVDIGKIGKGDRLVGTVKIAPTPAKMEIGTFEGVRFIETPQYGFEGDKWLHQVRYAQDEVRVTGHDVLVRFNTNEAPFLQYGRCAVKALGLCDIDVQEAYHKAAVLVRITSSMECEIIRNNVGVMDSVIRCGLPSRTLHTQPQGVALDVAAEKALTMPTPSWAKIAPELKAAPKVTPMPPELWWQKEQREAAEKLDEVVALRNDVRSLLGM